MNKGMIAVAAALSVGVVRAEAPALELLTPLIESNDTRTAVIVYGTSGGTWGDQSQTRVPAAFDGNTSTYTDLTVTEGWGGVGFVKPVCVTKVRHFKRPGVTEWASLAGALLQGADKSDFSDAVTVHVFNVEPVGGEWREESVSSSVGLTRAFRYYRIYTNESQGMGRRFGGLAEVEFYGFAPENPSQAMPASPTVTYTWMMNGRLCFTATADGETSFIEIQRRWSSSAEWEAFDVVPAAAGADQNYLTGQRSLRSAEFRFRAVGESNVSGWTDAVALVQPPYLTGTYVGTTTQYYDCYGRNAFDGNPWNIAEVVAADMSTAWAGLDFGEERTVTGLRYMTRYDQFAWRSADIIFEVANKSDFSDATVIYRTPSAHEAYELKTVYTVTFDQPFSGRYARFRSAKGEYFDVCEAEFDTVETPLEKPGLPIYLSISSAGDTSRTHPKVMWYVTVLNPPYRQVLMRAISPNGPWTQAAGEGERQQRGLDDGSANLTGRTYYYSLAWKHVVDGKALYGPVCPTVVSCIATGNLERDPATWTLSSDYKILVNGSAWNGNEEGWGAWRAFDNKVDTHADISGRYGCNTEKLGVDFGEPVCVLQATGLPRPGNVARFCDLCLYGTQKGAGDSDWMADEYAVKISAATPSTLTDRTWYNITSTSKEFFRSFFLGKADLANGAYWGCNVSELLFYGYPKTPKGLIAPADVAANVRKGHIVLKWADQTYATGWTVERRAGDTYQWVKLGETTVAAFDDVSAVTDGRTYQYRVTAANATEAAASVLSVAATPVSDADPWSGEAVLPTDRTGGACGIRWADTGDFRHFALTFKFTRGAGATATKFVPVVRTSLTDGDVFEGDFAELPNEGWFRIERVKGVLTLSYRAANGSWQDLGTTDAFPTGSVAVGIAAVGGASPLTGYTFSDATLAEVRLGGVLIIR